MKRLVLSIALFLGLGACSSPCSLAIYTDVPVVDQVAVNKALEPVAAIEADLRQSIMLAMMMGFQPTDEQRATLLKLADAFVYHQALATVAVYQGQSAVVDDQVARMAVLLREIKDIFAKKETF